MQQKFSSNTLSEQILKQISSRVSDHLGSLLVDTKLVDMKQSLTVRTALNELVMLITCVKEKGDLLVGNEEYLVYLGILNLDKIEEVDIPL